MQMMFWNTEMVFWWILEFFDQNYADSLWFVDGIVRA